jgi:hypothetical protein
MSKKVLLPLVIVTMAACSSKSGTPEGTGGGASLLDPPAAGQGVQYRMVSTLDPGQEIERVQFFQVPPEGLMVNREEVRYTPGSHHVLIYTTPYTSIPTMDINGNTVDTSGVIDAPRGGTADWHIDGVIAGSQSADAPPVVDHLPSNVAVKVAGGTVLLMNTHYLNTSQEPLQVEARINLYTVPAAQVTQEAGVLFYYDPIIRVPGNASSYAEMACPVASDITLVTLQTHMHARGIGGQAFVIPPGSSTPQSIYTSDSWQSPPVNSFSPALQIKAGSTLDYHCNYQNTQPNTVLQGLTTKDEMCMIVGVYYPKDDKTGLCSPDGNYDSLSQAGIWMGKDGTADCMTSVNCLFGATTNDATYSCILSACPAVAVPFNQTFKCMGSMQQSCEAGCKSDASPSTCTVNCLQQMCQTELAACQASACQ